MLRRTMARDVDLPRRGRPAKAGLPDHCQLLRSYSAQKRVECVKALPTTAQNFLVRKTFPGPSFEDAIDSNAFSALEFVVVQIGIVNHFSDLLRGFVPNLKTL